MGQTDTMLNRGVPRGRGSLPAPDWGQERLRARGAAL